MPIYELRCKGCHHSFQVLSPTMSLPEELECPQCGGKELRRLLSSFFARSAQTASAAAVPEACRQCSGGSETGCPFSK